LLGDLSLRRGKHSKIFLAVDDPASASSPGCVAVAALLQRVVLTLGMDLSWLLLVCNVVDLYLSMLVVGYILMRGPGPFLVGLRSLFGLLK
jgi:hypothetical protein